MRLLYECFELVSVYLGFVQSSSKPDNSDRASWEVGWCHASAAPVWVTLKLAVAIKPLLLTLQ